MDDPDAPAGDFTHWIVYKIPPTQTQLAQELPKRDKLTDGILQGRNSFAKLGYDGPAPPPGKAHHYRFRLYALKQALDMKPGETIDGLIPAMHGKVLDMGELVGTYKR